jgi:hypothetical protein
VRPPLTGPPTGAFKTLAPLRHWQNHPMAGTHLGVVKTSASPAWVDHTSDRLIKRSGRSCLPMSRERDRVLFAAREWDGVPSPLCLHLALAGCGFPGRRPGLFHFTDIFFETTANHHWWSLDLFKYGSGRGHVPKPNPKDHAWKMQYLRQEELTRVWPGGRRCGWECSPTPW